MNPDERLSWSPTFEDLALWKVFQLSGRPAMAGRCVTDGELSMATMPPDKVLSEAFMLRHAGHEVAIVSEDMDRLLRKSELA